MTVTNQNSHAILFVDDEEKALKMFTRLVSPHFTVLTAANVNEAKKVLEQKHREIGVLITDQRMPGEFGVDLLRHSRKEYPKIIRLLTTAYSDLDDAIQAVNTGEIFRYINKPWNADELLIDLRLAMNFFELEQDRLQLINEKMSLSHRQSRMEMMKGLITMSSAQTSYNRSGYAIKSFLEQVAEPQILVEKNITVENRGYWENEVAKTEKMIHINRSLSEWAYNAHANINTDSMCNSNEAVNYQAGFDQVEKDLGNHIKLEIADSPSQETLNQQGFTDLLEVLSKTLAKTNEGYSDLNAKISNEGQNTLISLQTGSPSQWLASQLLVQGDRNAEQVIGELLAAFVVVHHLGGQIKFLFNGSSLSEIQTMLPEKLNKANDIDLEGNIWIEDLFVLYN